MRRAEKSNIDGTVYPPDNESIGFYSVTGEQSRQAPSGNLAFQGVTYAFRPAHHQQRAIASRKYSADFRIHQSAYEKQRTFDEKKRYKDPTSSNTAGLAMPLKINASIPDVDDGETLESKTTWTADDIKRRSAWFADKIAQLYSLN
ncbi:hypothetical protein [uncultured Bifidobacterium sp.]|uniref:hypothetical protein n=1 Tax=uncultured Bifidobacterium sp. TaxID=165187 RepID=UPI00258D5436|nr:hypothetical protein [uncultured Bifidobacterium sp.]